MPTDFRAWFRDQLERRDLTQEAAARELDLSLVTVSRWARGRSVPTYADLDRIHDVWGVTPWTGVKPSRKTGRH